MFEYSLAIALGCIAAVALTILLYVKVLPTKLNGTFRDKKLQFLHDFFHFKKLYLEEVLKFIFTLATVACVTVGAFLLLGYDEYYGYYSSRRESTFLYGLCIMVGGPIALRLVYESLMMFILLVKNTMEINKKLPALEVEAPAPAEPSAPSYPGYDPNAVYPGYDPNAAIPGYDPNNGGHPPVQQ